eukprot:EG_transcript_14622
MGWVANKWRAAVGRTSALGCNAITTNLQTWSQRTASPSVASARGIATTCERCCRSGVGADGGEEGTLHGGDGGGAEHAPRSTAGGGGSGEGRSRPRGGWVKQGVEAYDNVVPELRVAWLIPKSDSCRAGAGRKLGRVECVQNKLGSTSSKAKGIRWGRQWGTGGWDAVHRALRSHGKGRGPPSQEGGKAPFIAPKTTAHPWERSGTKRGIQASKQCRQNALAQICIWRTMKDNKKKTEREL